MRRRVSGLLIFSVSLLLLSVVFGARLVDVSRLPLSSAPATSSTASVLVDPARIVKDYINDNGYKIGNRFTVNVNISGASDLFSCQVNLTWNNAVLNVSRIIPGEFLNRTNSPNKTASYQLGSVMNSTANAEGSAAFADSILGDFSGIDGDGVFVSIEFLVVGYGASEIIIGLTGSFPTMLIDSKGSNLAFTKTDGYFRNTIFGDVNGDETVDILDRSQVSAHWYPGPPVGPLGYDSNADINGDGRVDILDRAIVSANWGRHL